MKKILTVILFTVAIAALCWVLVGCDDNAPTVETHEDYTLYRNQRYGSNKRHSYDLALPSNASGELGIVFMIHGGGWHAGDKEVHEGDIISWAQRGYAAAALNYRYASKKIHSEDILDDIEACLASIKEQGKSLGVDISGALLAGGSAGGHLSLAYAYSRYESSPIPPVAVVSHAGPTDLADDNFYAEGELLSSLETMLSKISGTEATRDEYKNNIAKLRAVSPISYVGKNSVPTLICHGTLDNVVPVSNAYALDAVLTSYGITHDLIIFENSGHGLEADPECSEEASRLFLEYAQTYLKKQE